MSLQHGDGGSPGGMNQFGDTTFTKVFVGGLAWETHRDTMRRYFEQFGDILEAVVITDKNTGRSKGYGFVTFRDPEAARRACLDPSPIIDGRRANCNLASLGARPRPPAFHARFRPLHPGSPGPPGAPCYPVPPNFQQPGPYTYQQGYSYAQYGYPYPPDFGYQQNYYNPYGGQYSPFYGGPGGTPLAVYSYPNFGPPVPGGPAFPPGYQGPPMMQYGGGMPIQGPVQSGGMSPAHSGSSATGPPQSQQFSVPAPPQPQQMSQGNSS